MDDVLRQAVTAIKSGDKATGQKLLISLVQANPRNEYAWLWLSVTIDDPAKRRQCLERVLAINPDNGQAKQGLARLLSQSPQPPKKLAELPTKPVEPPPEPKSEPVPPPQPLPATSMQWIDREQLKARQETTAPQPPPKNPPLQKLKRLDSQDTKKCPYCAEIIKAEAKVCRFCGRDLDKEQQRRPTKPQPAITQPLPKKKQSSLVTCLVITGLIGLICVCGVISSPKTSSTLPTSTPSGPTPTSGPTPIKFDKIGAQVMCERFVTERLKAPSTAEFSWDQEVYSVTGKPKNYAIVIGYVDAQNSFGAMIRSNYRCELHYDIYNSDNWYLDNIEIE